MPWDLPCLPTSFRPCHGRAALFHVHTLVTLVAHRGSIDHARRRNLESCERSSTRSESAPLDRPRAEPRRYRHQNSRRSSRVNDEARDSSSSPTRPSAISTACFATLKQHTELDDIAVVVVDNRLIGRTLAELSRIGQTGPASRCCRQTRNTGFAEGTTSACAGRASAEPPFALLLVNQDIEVTPGWLKPRFRHGDPTGGRGGAAPGRAIPTSPIWFNTAGNQFTSVLRLLRAYRQAIDSLPATCSRARWPLPQGRPSCCAWMPWRNRETSTRSSSSITRDCDLQIRLASLATTVRAGATRAFLHKFTARFSARQICAAGRQPMLVLLKDWPLARLAVAAPALVGPSWPCWCSRPARAGCAKNWAQLRGNPASLAGGGAVTAARCRRNRCQGDRWRLFLTQHVFPGSTTRSSHAWPTRFCLPIGRLHGKVPARAVIGLALADEVRLVLGSAGKSVEEGKFPTASRSSPTLRLPVLDGETMGFCPSSKAPSFAPALHQALRIAVRRCADPMSCLMIPRRPISAFSRPKRRTIVGQRQDAIEAWRAAVPPRRGSLLGDRFLNSVRSARPLPAGLVTTSPCSQTSSSRATTGATPLRAYTACSCRAARSPTLGRLGASTRCPALTQNADDLLGDSPLPWPERRHSRAKSRTRAATVAQPAAPRPLI